MFKKRLWMVVLMIIITVIFCAFLGEFALRALGFPPTQVNPEQKKFWKYDSYLGWHHFPGKEGLFEKSPFQITVRLNQKGLRDRDYSYDRVPGRTRILILGDSFVWGFGVEQHQIFTEIVEHHLQNVEVINAGVSGYGTDQELLWFQSEGVRYSPDLVILLFSGCDDALNQLKTVYYIYDKPKFLLQKGGQLKLQNVPVPRASYFKKGVYKIMQVSSLMTRLVIAHKNIMYLFRRSPAFLSDNPYALSLALIDKIHKVADSIHAEFLVMAHGIFWASEAPYSDFITQLRAKPYPVIDIETLKGYSPSQMTIPGDGHWNSEGHQFIAEKLVETINHYKLLY